MGVPLIHVEAGERSPTTARCRRDESGRHRPLADLHFCASRRPSAGSRPRASAGTVHFVGDVMFDAARLREGPSPGHQRAGTARPGAQKSYALVTVHRAANTDGRSGSSDRRALNAAPDTMRLPGASADSAALKDLASCGAARQADRPGRLRRHARARLAGQARRHRFWRRAARGLHPRRPLSHAARRDRVGRDGRGPAGTSWSARSRARILDQWSTWNRRCSGRPSLAMGMPASASSSSSHSSKGRS